MFELASRGAQLDVAVLPYAPAADCDRWLLKLHGCVTRPMDIVLTREGRPSRAAVPLALPAC